MSRKVLLIAVIVLTLTTAVVHFAQGGGMLMGFAGRGPRSGQFSGNFQGTPPADRSFQGTPSADGQFQGQPNFRQGGGNSQFQGGPPGGFRGGRGGFGLFLFLPILFLLNGLTYLILLGALAIPIPWLKDHPGLTHWTLIGFAALTFALYFLINGFARFLGNPMAIIAKVAEVLLIVVTFLHWRAVKATPAAPTAPPAEPPTVAATP